MRFFSKILGMGRKSGGEMIQFANQAKHKAFLAIPKWNFLNRVPIDGNPHKGPACSEWNMQVLYVWVLCGALFRYKLFWFHRLHFAWLLPHKRLRLPCLW